MNILIIGTGEIEQLIIDLCLASKHLKHIYTASKKALENIPNIEYDDFEHLYEKMKSLQIDLAIVANKNLIEIGIVDFLRKKHMNIIGVTKKWFNLETSRLVAKQLISHYTITNPQIIKAPMEFPIIIKTDKPYSTLVATSLDDLVEKREILNNKKIYLEEFLNGEIRYLTTLWDGKNSWHNSLDSINEVQQERLNLYKTKLNFLLSDEKADFIGFFTTKLIWAKNDWYVLDYTMHLDKNSQLESFNIDFLYLLNLAIYQKLNELQ